jgi:DNA-directed RNA polymerase specialized sigma subunit
MTPDQEAELHKIALLEQRIFEEKERAVNTICFYYNQKKSPMQIYSILGVSTSMSRSIQKERAIMHVETAIKINRAELQYGATHVQH